MTDYSKLSDHQINAAVARAIGGFRDEDIMDGAVPMAFSRSSGM